MLQPIEPQAEDQNSYESCSIDEHYAADGKNKSILVESEYLWALIDPSVKHLIDIR